MKTKSERHEAVVWLLKWIAYELGCGIGVTLLMLLLRDCVPDIFASALEGETAETIASFTEWGQQACMYIIVYMAIICAIVLGVIIYRGIKRIRDAA